VLDPDSAPVDRAGIPLEMAPSKAGESVVRARRAGEQHVAVPLGVSAAPAYAAGEWTIVPVATAGLVSVVVRSASGIALGTPLAIADANTLVAVDRPPAVVVARAAQTSDSANASVELLAWINPPYHFAAPVIG
jgi:hypothetical protein